MITSKVEADMRNIKLEQPVCQPVKSLMDGWMDGLADRETDRTDRQTEGRAFLLWFHLSLLSPRCSPWWTDVA